MNKCVPPRQDEIDDLADRCRGAEARLNAQRLVIEAAEVLVNAHDVIQDEIDDLADRCKGAEARLDAQRPVIEAAVAELRADEAYKNAWQGEKSVEACEADYALDRLHAAVREYQERTTGS